MSRRRRASSTDILGLLITLLFLPFTVLFKVLASKSKKKQPAPRPRLTSPPRITVTRVPDTPQRPAQPLHLDIVWTEEFRPPETYQIEYADRFGEFSERTVHLSRKGHLSGHDYVGIYEDGQFKTLRADRILKAVPVSESALASPRPSLRVLPTYSTLLPAWPTPEAVFKIKTISGSRHWTVDLNAYSCTCPEKRTRAQSPSGSLGRVCPHMAEAILANLTPDAGWDPDLIAHISRPDKVSMSAYLGL